MTPGQIPRVALPALPAGTTGYNVYLSDLTTQPGPAIRYASGVTTSAVDLKGDAPTGGLDRPAADIATVSPLVDPAGGGAIGGHLAPGTYVIAYTFSYPFGVETYASPFSTPFTVAEGRIPQVLLPLLPVGVLPVGATGYNLYLSDSAADPGTATRYATGLSNPTFNLSAAATIGGVRPPANNIGTKAPVVVGNGGGVAGGRLAAGTYSLLDTFVYPDETETFAGPASAAFGVSAGDIPRVNLPPLPEGAVGYNLYLTNSLGQAGSATRYATAVASSTFDLRGAGPIGGLGRSGDPAASVAPTVIPKGGNVAGASGSLAPGSYFVSYTFTYASGTETFASPSSGRFEVAAGDIPQVTLPPLPDGATGYNLYLSDPSARAGSALRYASAITTSIVTLRDAAPTGGLSQAIVNNASTIPGVNPTGGGATGGRLDEGTYLVFYTFAYPDGSETFAGPGSAPFVVASGQIPTVDLPALPDGATGYNLYLTDPLANPKSASRYATGVTTRTFDLSRDALSGRIQIPASNTWTSAPAVNATGGGSGGGALAKGTYFLFYTFLDATGAESFISPASATFTVATGQVPQVSLPPLPAWATGVNLYLSDPSARAGSAIRYATAVTTTAFNLSIAAPSSATGPIPRVVATGGGTSGGRLAPGTYFVFFAPTDASGAEMSLSSSSAAFTVAAGAIPRVTLPPVPDGASGFDLYLSDSSATPGSATLYASGITSRTYGLENPAHVGGSVTMLAGDDVSIPGTTLVLARQEVAIRGDFGNADPGVGTAFDVDSAIVLPLRPAHGRGGQ